ncbi:MAG: DNA-processing protein DprA [Clostridiales bacterium]|nr:DNA-processing protein DprA [Clostridiales bacterium]
MREEHYWYWINNIEGIGRKTVWAMLEYFGSPKAVYEASEDEITTLLKKNTMIAAYLKSKNDKIIIEEYAQLAQKKVRFLYPLLKEYPRQYLDIPDAPCGLYLKGSLPPTHQKMVAVIGARNCSRYGLEMARFFGRELAKSGVSVVSGLARGVDGMAHQGALEGNGYTIGIIGGGIDRIYPQENYKLFMEMEQKGGILSEDNIGIAPVRGLFPQRNRLISGLCDGILVVEAMEKSGTFITVDQGLEQGKEIFAIPGRISDVKSVGCNNLIKLGAHIVTEVADILEVLHVKEKDNINNSYFETLQSVTSKMLLAPLEKMVYSCLRIEPKYIDDIINEAKIAPQEVCRALNRMTLNGIVMEVTRNYYAIKL